ncbi:hypothetical protein A7D27_26655 [Pseudomonas sp. 1D4]|uniref:type VI immunity family protein n=1 Tax=Pseudomonadaceae TaxID=135621 RepID=UPI00084B4D30|nr:MULTISPECIES: type VI immunity family protein [Pseudomonas]OEC34893.1 hypothetical protein A7D27_26655 [Pseudomonas sp. 1D4]
MNALDTLKQHAPDLEIEDAQGNPVVKLGLIATLYFREGYTAERKQRVIECFERFYEEFRVNLKGNIFEKNRKLTLENFERAKNQALATGENEQIYWCLNSSESLQHASIYCLSFMNTFQVHGEQDRSYIKLILPWTLLTEPEGAQRYKQWLTYLCNQVQAEHGYGGLSSILPNDYENYMPSEYQLAQRYSGLEVDTFAYAMGMELQNHIKGANWYTVLGQSYVERLGGEERLRHALSGHGDIVLLPYEQGLIIRAGDWPELGAQADGLPRAYVAVSNVVKPVRIPNPDQLHSYSPYGNCFDEASTQHWYQRFDLDPTPATPPRTEGGQRCPRAGYWFTPAQTNSLRRFAEGELMPVIEQSSWGHTFWYWSKEG